MFEEAELAQNALPLSPRKKACLSQCRLARFKAGDDILAGGCTCDLLSDCIFGFSDKQLPFSDTIQYYLDISLE